MSARAARTRDLPLLGAVGMLLSTALHAQAPAALTNPYRGWTREATGSIGPVSYDIPHAGSSFLGTGGFAMRFGPVILLELAGSLFLADLAPEGVSPYGSVEALLVADVDNWRLSPTLGAGAGYSFADEKLSQGLLLSGIAGARYRVSPDWALRLDFRVQSIDGGEGHLWSLTLGIRKRLR